MRDLFPTRRNPSNNGTLVHMKIWEKIKQQTTLEFVKSVAVGLASNAVDFLLTAVFLYAYGHAHYDGFWGVFSGATVGGPYEPQFSVYITATVIGYISAVLVNYLLSSVFVFKYGNVAFEEVIKA